MTRIWRHFCQLCAAVGQRADLEGLVFWGRKQVFLFDHFDPDQRTASDDAAFVDLSQNMAVMKVPFLSKLTSESLKPQVSRCVVL